MCLACTSDRSKHRITLRNSLNCAYTERTFSAWKCCSREENGPLFHDKHRGTGYGNEVWLLCFFPPFTQPWPTSRNTNLNPNLKNFLKKVYDLRLWYRNPIFSYLWQTWKEMLVINKALIASFCILWPAVLHWNKYINWEYTTCNKGELTWLRSAPNQMVNLIYFDRFDYC